MKLKTIKGLFELAILSLCILILGSLMIVIETVHEWLHNE